MHSTKLEKTGITMSLPSYFRLKILEPQLVQERLTHLCAFTQTPTATHEEIQQNQIGHGRMKQPLDWRTDLLQAL